MHIPEANDGKPIDADYHRFRAMARKTAFSPEEFSSIDRSRYDLDTARVTGEDNPQTYIGDDVGPGSTEPHDIREDPWR